MKSLVGRTLWGFDREVAQWVSDRIPGYTAGEDATALGFIVDGELAAGVVYERWNGIHCEASIAVDNKRWASRQVLRDVFAYPFYQLGCEAMTALVASTNLQSLNLTTKLGFEVEALIRYAAPDGSSLIVLKMFRDKCKWIRNDGQRRQQSTETT